MDKKFYRIGFFLSILLLLSLSCNLVSFMEGPNPAEIEREQIMHLTQAAQKVTQTFLATTPDYIWLDATVEPPMKDISADEDLAQDSQGNPDEKIIFNYLGENPSYHTGLRNRTAFYLDNDTGKVWADEKASFEEPFGIQTAQGTDSIRFDGSYDDNTETFSGSYSITTQFTATGGESGSTNVTYNLNGILSARLVDGKWSGTVTGKSTLKQEWPGGDIADSLSESNINWTITSTSIEKVP